MVWLNFAFVCSSLMQKPSKSASVASTCYVLGTRSHLHCFRSWQRYFGSKSILNCCSLDACRVFLSSFLQDCGQVYALYHPAGASLALGTVTATSQPQCMHMCAHRHTCLCTCVHISISIREALGTQGWEDDPLGGGIKKSYLWK